MRNFKLHALVCFIAGIAAITASQALACDSNSDCDYGSRCVKARYGDPGVCVGGRNPGNSYDAQPSYDNAPAGNTCSSSYDCGYGYACVRSGYQGVCVRR